MIQKRNIRELVHIFTEPAKDDIFIRMIERLLSGAAEEELSLTFLYFTIPGLNKFIQPLGIRRVRKLVSELLVILVEKTPDELYADCPGPNEFMLLLPGVPKNEAHKAGIKIRERFLKAAESIINNTEINLDLAGSVISFPEDGANTTEILCQARDAAAVAQKPGEDSIQIVQPITQQTISLKLPSIQLSRIKNLAEKQSISESSLIRHAMDEYLKNS